VLEDIQDFIIMRIFKLKTKSDTEKMHKKVVEMKNTKDHDNMKKTMSSMKKKALRDEYQEEEEKRFQE
jgi:hypothetical protein